MDAYFEETQLASVREGDPATLKLMGYSQIIQGEVAGIARGINVANAQPNDQGLATVAGMTATVQIDSPPAPAKR